jgi:hypothetical protein
MANERLINSVSVGIVYVGAPGDYAISAAEQAHILAEVQDGLDTLATNEPRANLSWAYSALTVNLPSFTPWQGANWPGLTEPFYREIDAALWSGTTGKIYFFRGGDYIRVDPANGWRADPGYPKPIAGNWPGFPASFTSGLSDALWSGTTGKIYFFKGSEYLRVDPANGWQVDPGYPKPIAGNWPGFPADFALGIEAALWSQTNQRIYFFKGDQYIRVDPNAGWAVEAGYPKTISGNWPGFPDDFTEGVNAALWSGPNQKIYFFKKNRFYNQYIRVDPANGWQVDAGYPKPVGLGWDAEDKWRDPALAQLGYPAGGAGIEQLTQFFQNAVGAQFGYLVFFTKMPTAWFAYAGGLRVVMRQTTGPFTNWNSIDSIFAHETGHIFGAPDEYSSSKCKCDSVHGRFIRAVNGNCAVCAASSVSCLMKNNTLTSLCEYTPAHLGWEAFLDRIDGGLHAFKNDKLYMFSQKYYLRYSDGFVVDPEYPKPIAGNWPGFPAAFADGIDAALWSPTNARIYFFKGSEYIRVNPDNGWNVDPGYPKPIAGNWPGFPANFATGVDAALHSKTNQRLYFFKGDRYLRINPASSWAVEAGYPKPIAGNWPGFPADFAAGIDTAEWSDFNQRIYFFKGVRYIRTNPANAWNVDGGYPKDINVNWRMAFPTA